MASSPILFYNPVWTVNDLIGQPNEGGFIYFKDSTNPTLLKTVYKDSLLTNPWPNPIKFDITGAQNDNYLIYGTDNGPYRVEITNELNAPVKVFDPFPYATPDVPIIPDQDIENYIINGQLFFDEGKNFLSGSSQVHGFEFLPTTNSPILIAPDNWYFKKNGAGATDQLLITDFIPGETNPPNNPKAYFNYICTSPSNVESSKFIYYQFNSVRMFAGKTINFQFNGYASFPTNIEIVLNQFFGVGGSTGIVTTIETISLTTTPTNYEVVMPVPSITGSSIGIGGDDAFLILFQLPVNAVCNIKLNSFCLRIGNTFVSPQEESVNITETQIIASQGSPTTNVNSADGNYYPVLRQRQKNWDYNSLAGKIVDQGFAYDNGWDGLQCNGTLVNSAAYYNLVNKITTNHGVGLNGFYSNTPNGVTFTTTATGATGPAHDLDTHMYIYTVTAGASGVSQVVQLICSSGNKIPNSSYFRISNITTQFYYWFNKNGSGVDPAPAGTGKMVAYTGSETPAQMAALIAAISTAGTTAVVPTNTITITNVTNGTVSAINAGTSTLIVAQTSAGSASTQATATITFVAGASIINGSYVTINAESRAYYLWFSLNNKTEDPGSLPALSTSTGIKVIYDGTETNIQMAALAAQQFINAQVKLPGGNGLFTRMIANGSTNDPNRNARIALNAGGNVADNIGSFQLDEFKNHTHGLVGSNVNGPGDRFAVDESGTEGPRQTLGTGGDETRPKNFYVDKIILI